MIRGKDGDDIIAKVQKHFNDVHAGIEFSREQVLAMARPDTLKGDEAQVLSSTKCFRLSCRSA